MGEGAAAAALSMNANSRSTSLPEGGDRKQIRGRRAAVLKLDEAVRIDNGARATGDKLAICVTLSHPII